MLNSVFSFTNDRHYRTTFCIDTMSFPAYFREQLFSTDMTKMAVNFWNQKDGSNRVGWVDANGILTDVSENIHPTTDGFSSMAPNDTNALFSPDGEFFFSDMNAEKYCYLDPETMQIVKEEPMESQDRVVFLPKDHIRSAGITNKGSGANYKTTIGDSSFYIEHEVLKPWDYIDEANQIVGIGAHRINNNWCSFIGKYGGDYSVNRNNIDDLILTPETDFDITACAYYDGKIAFSAQRGDDNELFIMEDNKGSEPIKVASLDKYDRLFMWLK